MLKRLIVISVLAAAALAGCNRGATPTPSLVPLVSTPPVSTQAPSMSPGSSASPSMAPGSASPTSS